MSNLNLKNINTYKKAVGRFGERLASEFLERRGYKIIAANQKIGYLELDLIATKAGDVVFVEVKTRTTAKLGQADESLTKKQFHNLKKALALYCLRNRLNFNRARLDLIAIDLNHKNKTAKIKHYKDIF